MIKIPKSSKRRSIEREREREREKTLKKEEEKRKTPRISANKMGKLIF
jgi:hypothetical protein